jgi:hypothetical protein
MAADVKDYTDLCKPMWPGKYLTV